jgi:ATP-dependent Clp protease ATP-binding subunit ClpC
LKKVFNPEFLNRIDDVITFKPLDKKDIFQIIDILGEELFSRIREVGYEIEITKGAKDFITDKGFDPKYGARPLKRAIQKYIEDPLAEELLENKKEEGSTIKIKMNKSRDALAFDWTTPDPKKKEKKSSEDNDSEISDESEEAKEA